MAHISELAKQAGYAVIDAKYHNLFGVYMLQCNDVDSNNKRSRKLVMAIRKSLESLGSNCSTEDMYASVSSSAIDIILHNKAPHNSEVYMHEFIHWLIRTRCLATTN